eukprot:4539041-Prymnesium_polylepis.2
MRSLQSSETFSNTACPKFHGGLTHAACENAFCGSYRAPCGSANLNGVQPLTHSKSRTPTAQRSHLGDV